MVHCYGVGKRVYDRFAVCLMLQQSLLQPAIILSISIISNANNGLKYYDTVQW